MTSPFAGRQKFNTHGAHSRGSLTSDDTAVSEIVGTVLMVGLTVVAMGGFGAYLLSLEPPEGRFAVDLEVHASPGAGGWGTGDETIILRHLGGEPLQQSSTRITIDVGSSQLTFEEGSLAGAFADGEFTVGETWRQTTTITEGEAAKVSVVTSNGGGSTLVLSANASPIAQTAVLPLLLLVPKFNHKMRRLLEVTA